MSVLPGRGLRAGIIGTGFTGSVHAAALRATGASVSAVAGRTSRSALGGRDRIGAATASPSPEALIDSPDIDVVHICTPNETHVRLASRAARITDAVLRSASTNAWVDVADPFTTPALVSEGQH